MDKMGGCILEKGDMEWHRENWASMCQNPQQAVYDVLPSPSNLHIQEIA